MSKLVVGVLYSTDDMFLVAFMLWVSPRDVDPGDPSTSRRLCQLHHIGEVRLGSIGLGSDPSGLGYNCVLEYNRKHIVRRQYNYNTCRYVDFSGVGL